MPDIFEMFCDCTLSLLKVVVQDAPLWSLWVMGLESMTSEEVRLHTKTCRSSHTGVLGDKVEAKRYLFMHVYNMMAESKSMHYAHSHCHMQSPGHSLNTEYLAEWEPDPLKENPSSQA